MPRKGKEKIIDYIENGNLENLRIFLQNNPDLDLNFLDSEKSLSPLHFAAAKGGDYIMNLLIDHGAKVDINSTRNTQPIHFCTNAKVLKILLDKGIDVNICDNIGYTPLHYAVLIGNSQVAMELMERKADVNIQTVTGQTAKDILLEKIFEEGSGLGCARNQEDAVEYYKKLLSSGNLNDNIIIRYSILEMMNNVLAKTKEELTGLGSHPKEELFLGLQKKLQKSYVETQENIDKKYQQIFNIEEGKLWSYERRNAELLKFINTTLAAVIKYHNPLISFIDSKYSLSNEERDLSESLALFNSAGMIRMVSRAIHSLPGEVRGKYSDKLPFNSNPWHRLEILGKVVAPLGGVDKDMTSTEEKRSIIAVTNSSKKPFYLRLAKDIHDEIPVTESALVDIIKEDLPNLLHLTTKMFNDIRGVQTEIDPIELSNILAITNHVMTNDSFERLGLLTIPSGVQELLHLEDQSPEIIDNDIALSGTLDGYNLNFSLSESLGDGDCAFRSLLGGEFLQGAIDRSTIIKIISDEIDSQENISKSDYIRGLIAIDIEQKYQEYISGEALEIYFPQNLKDLFEECRTKELGFNGSEKERSNMYSQEIRKRFLEPNYVKSYLTEYISGHPNYKDVWPMLGGVVDAAALCLEKQVHYWHVNNGKLELLHSNKLYEEPEETIHILHNGIHFDRLMPGSIPDILPTNNQKISPDFIGDFGLALALQMSFDRLNSPTDSSHFRKKIEREKSAVRVVDTMSNSSKEKDLGGIEHPHASLLDHSLDRIDFKEQKQKYSLLRRLQYVGEFLTEQHTPSSVKSTFADVDLDAFRIVRDAICHPWDQNYHQILKEALSNETLLDSFLGDLKKLNQKIPDFLEKYYSQLQYDSDPDIMWSNIKDFNLRPKVIPAKSSYTEKNDFIPSQNLLQDDEISNLLGRLIKPSGFKDAKEVEEVRKEWDEILHGGKSLANCQTNIKQYFPSKKTDKAANGECSELYQKAEETFSSLFSELRKKEQSDKTNTKISRSTNSEFPNIRKIANRLEAKTDKSSRPSKTKKARIALDAIQNLKQILEEESGVKINGSKNDFVHHNPSYFSTFNKKISEDVELRYALEYNLYLALEMTLAVAKYRESSQTLKDKVPKIEKERKYLAHGDAVMDSEDSRFNRINPLEDRILVHKVINVIFELENDLTTTIKKLNEQQISSGTISVTSASNLQTNSMVNSSNRTWTENMINSNKKGITHDI